MRISDWSSDVCSSDLVSKPVAIEQRQWGAGPDAPQVEGRCPVDVDVLVLCALPRTDTGVLAAAEILRQAARNLAEIGLTAIADIFARDADHRGCGRGAGDPAAGHDDVFLRRTALGLDRKSTRLNSSH